MATASGLAVIRDLEPMPLQEQGCIAGLVRRGVPSYAPCMWYVLQEVQSEDWLRNQPQLALLQVRSQMDTAGDPIGHSKALERQRAW